MSYVCRNHPQQKKKDFVDDREITDSDFEVFNERFSFSIDVAASINNAKLPRYFTKEDNGLEKEWLGRVWCNPPYSDISNWVQKAWREWDAGSCELIVMLLPANRTEQVFWADYVETQRMKIPDFHVEFLKGRRRFIAAGDTKIQPNSRPPFGLCLLIWDR